MTRTRALALVKKYRRLLLLDEWTIWTDLFPVECLSNGLSGECEENVGQRHSTIRVALLAGDDKYVERVIIHELAHLAIADMRTPLVDLKDALPDTSYQQALNAMHREAERLAIRIEAALCGPEGDAR